MIKLLRLSTLFVVIAVFYGIKCDDLKKCIKKSPCQCEINDFNYIDISSVLGKEPYLTDSYLNITYYFSGCKNIFLKDLPVQLDDGVNPNTAAALFKLELHNTQSGNKTTQNSTLKFSAKAEDINFNIENGEYQLVFNVSNSSSLPVITLLCTRFPIPFIKVLNNVHDTLVLSSSQVCVVTKHHGLSTGTIFLLILFIVLVVYFLGGGLRLYFLRGARGIEVIPNINFWRNLPDLVKDGVIFLLSGCRTTVISTAETYDRI